MSVIQQLLVAGRVSFPYEQTSEHVRASRVQTYITEMALTGSLRR